MHYCTCNNRKSRITTNYQIEQYTCANCGREIVKLKPGDYVSTEGMTEEQYHAVCKAFMEAGADKGEEYIKYRGIGDYLGWNIKTNGIFHGYNLFKREWAKEFIRELTIDQILGKEKDMGNKDMRGNAAESSVSLAEAYKVMQANCGIEIGDTVKVLRKAKSFENGWKFLWIDSMKVGTIAKVDAILENGIHLDCGCLFPFFVLELVKKAPKLPSPIRISSGYKAEFREDGGIDVGCQRLSFDMIEQIYLTAKEVKENCDGQV